MYERFTDRAKRVMTLSNQEAQRFFHEYIGTEHILLGLVKEGSGCGVQALRKLGFDPRKIRMEVEKQVQSGSDIVSMGKLPQTPRAKKVIEYAMEEARNLNHNFVGTEHLLLGLMRENKGVAAEVLVKLGLMIEKARETVVEVLKGEEASVGGSPSASESGASSQLVVEPSPDQLQAIDDFCEDVGISRTLFLRMLRRPGKVEAKCLADATEADFVNAACWCARQGIVKCLQEIANWPGWKKQGVTGQPE